jgi:hypothetical protein
MKPFRKLFPSLKLFSSLTAAALGGFLLAVFSAQHGCASNCASACPATTVYIGSIDNTQLSVSFFLNGPACPPTDSLPCIGDENSTTCTHTTITGQGVGRCDVLVEFNPNTDGRASEVVQLQFGPTYSASGTCCKGFPVVGPSTYVIPDYPNGGGIYSSADGGSRDYDGIVVVRDAGADARDGGAADAGADSLSADAD